jgi:hypothetical protein
MGPQKAPDILLVDVTQSTGQQRCCPVRIPGSWRPVEHGQKAVAMLRPILRLGAPSSGLLQARHAVAGVAYTPLGPGVQPISRPMAREAIPPAVSSTIRAIRASAPRPCATPPALPDLDVRQHSGRSASPRELSSSHSGITTRASAIVGSRRVWGRAVYLPEASRPERRRWVASGTVVGRHYKHRRRIEFLDFMNRVVAQHLGRKFT